MLGEALYTCTLEFTNVTDYGVSLEDMLSGQAPIPAQGAQIDVAFAGQSEGRLAGTLSGVDYLKIRADGRFDLDIHGTIETKDGARIALRIVGTATPRADAPIVDLRESISFQTASADYGWVNTVHAWAKGTVDLSKGRIEVQAFA